MSYPARTEGLGKYDKQDLALNNLEYLICHKTQPNQTSCIIVSKVGNRSRGWPEGSLFNSYYTEVWGRVLLLSLYCSTLPSIRTLYCWVLSKKVSSTIFKVFGMTRPRNEPRSPGPLANTLPIRPSGLKQSFLTNNCQSFAHSHMFSSKVWFSFVSWHINHKRLFYVKSSLYIYIKYEL